MINNDFVSNTQGGAVPPRDLSSANSKTSGVYMAKLGGYMFSLDTAAFKQLQRTTEYRWGQMNRIGRKPASQFLGEGTDTIRLSGVIYPHFRGGMHQLGIMRGNAGKGDPLPLVYAFEQVGQYCGLWCITGIEEGRTEFFRDGAPRKVEFSLTLIAYGEDFSSGASLAGAVAAGSPLATFAPPPPLFAFPASPLLSNAFTIADLPYVNANSTVGDVNLAAGAVSGTASSVSSAINTARETISGAIKSATNDVLAIIPPSAINAAREMVNVAIRSNAATRSITDSIKVVRDTASAVKGVATVGAATMDAINRDAGSLSGTIKAAASALASASGAAETAANRIQAAATMGNVDRAADGIMFALKEGQKQFTDMADKINV